MSDHDPLDERLREYAERWRAGLPPVREPDLRKSTGPRWGRSSVVAAAAAVLVVAVVGVAVRSGTEHAAPPTETHPARPTTASGRPQPNHFEGVPECTVGDVRFSRSAKDNGAAMGTAYRSVHIRLVADHSCWFERFPNATLLHGLHPLFEARHESAGPPAPGQRVLIDGSHRWKITVGWAVSHSCPSVENDTIRLTLGRGMEYILPGFGRSTCNPDERRALPFVWPIQVDRRGGR